MPPAETAAPVLTRGRPLGAESTPTSHTSCRLRAAAVLAAQRLHVWSYWPKTSRIHPTSRAYCLQPQQLSRGRPPALHFRKWHISATAQETYTLSTRPSFPVLVPGFRLCARPPDTTRSLRVQSYSKTVLGTRSTSSPPRG